MVRNTLGRFARQKANKEPQGNGEVRGLAWATTHEVKSLGYWEWVALARQSQTEHEPSA